VDRVRISGGRYVVPELPGTSAEMVPSSVQTYSFPWSGDEPPPVPEFHG